MYIKGDTLEHFVYSLELDSQHDKKKLNWDLKNLFSPCVKSFQDFTLITFLFSFSFVG